MDVPSFDWKLNQLKVDFFFNYLMMMMMMITPDHSHPTGMMFDLSFFSLSRIWICHSVSFNGFPIWKHHPHHHHHSWWLGSHFNWWILSSPFFSVCLCLFVFVLRVQTIKQIDSTNKHLLWMFNECLLFLIWYWSHGVPFGEYSAFLFCWM